LVKHHQVAEVLDNLLVVGLVPRNLQGDLVHHLEDLANRHLAVVRLGRQAEVEVSASRLEAVRSANRQAVEVLVKHHQVAEVSANHQVEVLAHHHQAVGLEVKALNPNRHQEAAGFH